MLCLSSRKFKFGTGCSLVAIGGGSKQFYSISCWVSSDSRVMLFAIETLYSVKRFAWFRSA